MSESGEPGLTSDLQHSGHVVYPSNIEHSIEHNGQVTNLNHLVYSIVTNPHYI